jgi:RNA polymerase sigma-70 factor, ECF subfamily
MERVLTIQVHDPDREAIEDVRRGNADAFEGIVVHYHRQIFALAFRMVHSQEEAADLTQEIFIRAWQKLDSFRGESKFSTWLFQIAGNHCKNRLKYLKRRHYYQHESIDSDPSGGDAHPVRQLPDPSHDPEEDLAGNQVQEIVRNKLEELPEEQRVVLVMRDIEDLDYDEIAAATGLPLGTVKSRIHRGRIELARKLKEALSTGSV